MAPLALRTYPIGVCNCNCNSTALVPQAALRHFTWAPGPAGSTYFLTFHVTFQVVWPYDPTGPDHTYQEL